MLFHQLFRDNAVAWRGRPEPLDSRLQVTAPHEWMLLAGLGAVMLALIAWGFLGRVERSVGFDAVLIQSGERHAVVSPLSGNIGEVLVAVGDTVEQGQPIARLQLPGGQRRAAIARRLVEAVEAESPDSTEGLRSALLDAALVELRGLNAADLAQEFVYSPIKGEVVTLRLLVGQPVGAGAVVGQISVGGDDTLEAVALIPENIAAVLLPGMAVRVVSAAPGGDSEYNLSGRISEISAHAVTPPVWLSGFNVETPHHPHLLRVEVFDLPPSSIIDGAEAFLRIVLRRDAPVALLTGRGD